MPLTGLQFGQCWTVSGSKNSILPFLLLSSHRPYYGESYMSEIQANSTFTHAGSACVPYCTEAVSGFFDHGEVYTAPGLLVTGGTQLSQRGKRILGHELAGLIERALN